MSLFDKPLNFIAFSVTELPYVDVCGCRRVFARCRNRLDRLMRAEQMLQQWNASGGWKPSPVSAETTVSCAWLHVCLVCGFLAFDGDRSPSASSEKSTLTNFVKCSAFHDYFSDGKEYIQRGYTTGNGCDYRNCLIAKPYTNRSCWLFNFSKKSQSVCSTATAAARPIIGLRNVFSRADFKTKSPPMLRCRCTDKCTKWHSWAKLSNQHTLNM